MISAFPLSKKRNIRRIFASIIMLLLPMIDGFAAPITTTMLLESQETGVAWDASVPNHTEIARFLQTASGGTDATVITTTQLGFFTSTDCSGSLAGTGFYVTPSTHTFPIPASQFALTAAATWNVGVNKLGLSGQMGGIQSIAVTFRSTTSNTPQSCFGSDCGTSSANRSSFACIQGVTCSSGECTSSNSSTPQNFMLKTTASIGDAADGGVIACMNGGLNNLVAPTTDNNGGTAIGWGGFGTTTNATSDTDGATNTSTIVNCLSHTTSGGCPGNIAENTYAAGICSNYSASGGYTTGWFLPADHNLSSSQLNCLFTNQGAIGGFASAFYWSSTEFDAFNAWRQGFSGGAQDNISKSFLSLVRCVRALSL